MASLAIFLAAQALAAAQPDESPTQKSPPWISRPTSKDVERFYPPEAIKRGLNGNAEISCTVAKDGSLAKCAVVREAPEGFGFGEAALKMAPKFQMRPQLSDGSSVEGGTVKIPLGFRHPNTPTHATLQMITVPTPEGVRGSATVTCQIGCSSQLENCVASKVRPPSLEPLALKAASEVKVPPGSPIRLPVVIPFTFKPASAQERTQ